MVSYRPVGKQFRTTCQSAIEQEKMEDVSTHESLMTDFVNTLINSKKSQVLSGALFDQITEYLSNLENQKIDANFKFWITKERQFLLQDLPGLGLNGVLACPAKQKKEVSTCTNIILLRPTDI